MEKQSVLTIGLLANEKPEAIYDLKNGQGTFMYNHNITEVLIVKDENGGVSITTDNNLSTGKMFQYDTVRVEYPKTGDNIFSTLLSAKYPAQRESKLANEYQSALLGLLDESYKAPYETFLSDRLAIRAFINSDCEILNIPIE